MFINGIIIAHNIRRNAVHPVGVVSLIFVSCTVMVHHYISVANNDFACALHVSRCKRTFSAISDAVIAVRVKVYYFLLLKEDKNVHESRYFYCFTLGWTWQKNHYIKDINISVTASTNHYWDDSWFDFLRELRLVLI